jgi:hypothetical protein
MKKPGKVRRITIDERLAENLIRILVADLKPGRKEFRDDPEYWEEEVELLVHPEDYRKKMGIPEEAATEWPWRSLYESQVFLSGGFRKISGEGAETKFVVDAGQRNFQCIDDVSKERVKKNYVAVLERRL